MFRFSKYAVTVVLFLFVSNIALTAKAKVDWEVSNAIQLKETPLDVAQTQEGDLTFLLTDQAKVLIYSADGKGEQLFLINSKRKTLQTVEVDFIVDFNVADAPFLGPAGAEVVVAVFSDFQ